MERLLERAIAEENAKEKLAEEMRAWEKALPDRERHALLLRRKQDRRRELARLSAKRIRNAKKAQAGPKPEHGQNRERFKSAPVVSLRTKRCLEMWRTVYGVPVGRSIDSLLAFAAEHPTKYQIK